MSSTGNPQHRCAVLQTALGDVGYSDAHIQLDWPLSDRRQLRRFAEDRDPGSLPSGQPARLDLVAFYHEHERNWDTTAFVAELDRLDLVQNKEHGCTRARELFDLTAAPCAFFAGNRTADLWLKCWQQPEPVRDIPFESEALRRTFRQHRRDVERDALARLRGGQRYLFDGVYHAQREELVQFLHMGLSKATWLAPELTKKDSEKEYEPERKALSRVAIALMAARILEDKGYFGSSGQSTNARQILEEAEHAANGFFQAVIHNDLARLGQRLNSQLVEEMLKCLMAHLTGPASFSMVTPDAIGYLYETALMAERRQRGKEVELNGIHYTPRPIAQHILDRIPVEEMRPSQRYVADIACGSGSFLLAGTQRLREVFDARESEEEGDVVAHLQDHVIGNDTDRIAVLVTKLAYLLEHWISRSERAGVPEPQRLWERDALDLSETDFAGCRPSMIVGNPPFASAAGGQQLANQFLLKALDLLRPGGYLGMIMPGGLLKMLRQKAPAIRKTLLSTCELLEVWEQPLEVVGLTARQETCVIIARKYCSSEKSQRPVLFKSTYSSKGPAKHALRENLRSTWTFAAGGPPGRPDVSWRADEDSRIIASPIDCVWGRLELEQALSALCEIGTGIDAPLGKAEFSPRKEPGFVPYLRSQRRLKPFFLQREDWWKDDPDSEHRFVDPSTGHRPRKLLRALFEAPKIVVSFRNNRNSDSQLVAAYDDQGVFPEHDFRCVAISRKVDQEPRWATQLLSNHRERELLLWLTAVLNSLVAHAWVATCSPPRGPLEIVLLSLPLPPEFDEDIPRLVEETAQVERAIAADAPLWDASLEGTPSKFMGLAVELNKRVLASYGLGRKDVDLLKQFLRGMTDPWVDASKTAHLPIEGAAYLRITGKVVEVDVKRQQVTLDLPRYRKKAEGPVKVPLPKHMPGWALRAGVEFTCLAPVNRRDPSDLQDPWLLREFRLLPYSYLQPSEIEKIAGFEVLDATT